jgi:hypothetical protein
MYVGDFDSTHTDLVGRRARPSRERRPISLALALTVFVVASASSSEASEFIDEAVLARIKMEGFQRSQVMETLSYLTDVHGPRLTGSPGLRSASAWSRDKLAEWGLRGAHLESWGRFGRGWSVEGHSVEITAPRYARLIAYPHAWSPGTTAPLTGEPVLVEINGEEDFGKYEGKLRDRIILRGKPARARSRFEAAATRIGGDEIERARRAIDPGEPRGYWEEGEEWEKDVAKERTILSFLQDQGVAAIVEASARDGAIVRVSALGYYLGTDFQRVASFVMAKEHYGMILRLLEKEVDVSLRLSLDVRFHQDDLDGYNVVAEIPGTDSRIGDEIVLVGAHLDSWHSGTGATDNASGSAVMMEAVRILAAIGVKPRRTIRIGLWTGEEQGYFGSIGHVRKHFGDPATQALQPGHDKLSAYYNLDNGTGRIRGVHLQGNEAARSVLRDMLAPFDYLEASSLTTTNTGGTDHMPFQALGLPAFQFIQDPIDYDTRTHHTNIDVYENVIEEDLQQAAVIIASLAYHTAMRDEKIPRPLMPKRPTEKTSVEKK